MFLGLVTFLCFECLEACRSRCVFCKPKKPQRVAVEIKTTTLNDALCSLKAYLSKTRKVSINYYV